MPRSARSPSSLDDAGNLASADDSTVVQLFLQGNPGGARFHSAGPKAQIPVISRATAHVDLADEQAAPRVDVALTLVGGDEAHTAVLESFFIGSLFDQQQPLDLRFPTPTVHMDPRSQVVIPLVGAISRADLVGHCQSTLPLGATLSFEDTANISSFSPPGQLAVFCD